MTAKPLAARAGLSLMELIVVVTIVVVLAALLMPALGHLRNSQRRLESLRQIEELRLAVTLYLQSWPLLGSGQGAEASAFCAAPLRWLGRPRPGETEPFFQAAGKRSAMALPDGSLVPASGDDASVLLDAWGNPVSFRVLNGPVGAADGSFAFADLIEIRSQGQLADTSADDLAWRFSVSGDVDPRDGRRDAGVTPREWVEIIP